jgi:hypothetical protein
MKPNTRITQLRAGLGWSIARLAYESSVPASVIDGIEAGRLRDGRAVSKLHNAFQAAKRLAATPMSIPGIPVDKPLSAYQLSDDRMQLIEQLKAMTPEERAALRTKLLRSLRRPSSARA